MSTATHAQAAAPIASATVVHERKTFTLELRENARGKFVRCVEQTAGHRDTLMIPTAALGAIIEALQKMESAA